MGQAGFSLRTRKGRRRILGIDFQGGFHRNHRFHGLTCARYHSGHQGRCRRGRGANRGGFRRAHHRHGHGFSSRGHGSNRCFGDSQLRGSRWNSLGSGKHFVFLGFVPPPGPLLPSQLIGPLTGRGVRGCPLSPRGFIQILQGGNRSATHLNRRRCPPRPGREARLSGVGHLLLDRLGSGRILGHTPGDKSDANRLRFFTPDLGGGRRWEIRRQGRHLVIRNRDHLFLRGRRRWLLLDIPAGSERGWQFFQGQIAVLADQNHPLPVADHRPQHDLVFNRCHPLLAVQGSDQLQLVLHAQRGAGHLDHPRALALATHALREPREFFPDQPLGHHPCCGRRQRLRCGRRIDHHPALVHGGLAGRFGHNLARPHPASLVVELALQYPAVRAKFQARLASTDHRIRQQSRLQFHRQKPALRHPLPGGLGRPVAVERLERVHREGDLGASACAAQNGGRSHAEKPQRTMQVFHDQASSIPAGRTGRACFRPCTTNPAATRLSHRLPRGFNGRARVSCSPGPWSLGAAHPHRCPHTGAGGPCRCRALPPAGWSPSRGRGSSSGRFP